MLFCIQYIVKTNKKTIAAVHLSPQQRLRGIHIPVVINKICAGNCYNEEGRILSCFDFLLKKNQFFLIFLDLLINGTDF
jgi:hypothetical protein